MLSRPSSIASRTTDGIASSVSSLVRRRCTRRGRSPAGSSRRRASGCARRRPPTSRRAGRRAAGGARPACGPARRRACRPRAEADRGSAAARAPCRRRSASADRLGAAARLLAGALALGGELGDPRARSRRARRRRSRRRAARARAATPATPSSRATAPPSAIAERDAQRRRRAAQLAERPPLLERAPRRDLGVVFEVERVEHEVARVPAARGHARQRRRLVVGRQRDARELRARRPTIQPSHQCPRTAGSAASSAGGAGSIGAARRPSIAKPPPADRELAVAGSLDVIPAIRRVDPRAAEVRQHDRLARREELAEVGH